MSWLRRLRGTFLVSRLDDAFDEEARFHLEARTDDFVRDGLSRQDAAREARRRLGSLTVVRDEARDVDTLRWLDDLAQDARYAARQLRRNPLFAATASLSLAIGIGANTTIFTIANALLLRAPFGVVEPGRLADIFRTERGVTLADPTTGYDTYLEVRRRATSFDGVYAHQLTLEPMSLRVPAGGAAERIFTTFVSTNYFTVLGVGAAAGRLFAAGDSEQPGASPTVVLSHRFWTRRFQADPTLVGQTLQLNGQALTVVGVAAEGFLGSSVLAADLWVPAAMAAVINPEKPDVAGLLIGGRLKRGVAVAQAAAEVDVIGRGLLAQSEPIPARGPGLHESKAAGLRLVPASPIPGNLRLVLAGFLALLMALVSLVLVITCANLAGVLLARAAARRREISIRLAMGSGRARLVRLLLTETVLLFAIGGIVGLLLARVMTSVLLSVLPAFPLPVGLSLPLDGRVVAFTAGLSLIAALLSGLAPALHASQADVVSALKDDAQGPADRLRLRSAFVMAQVAFSLMLVVVGGLLVRAQARVTAVDHGFDPHDVEVVSLDLSMAGYTAATGPGFARDLVNRVRTLPAIQAAALADSAPTGRLRTNGGLSVPGVVAPDGQPIFMTNRGVVEPGFFAAMRIPLLAGRDFNDDDRAGAQAVVIVDERAAGRFWPGHDPVGQYVWWNPPVFPPGPATRLLVIGVARTLKESGPPAVMSVHLAAYVPLQQSYVSEMTLLARGHDRRLAGDLRALVRSMNPNLPILNAQTLEEQMTGPVEVQLRVAAAVAGSIGTVSVLLAAIGIYGVMAYAVTRRTREIGIRLALGARRADVLRMVVREGLALVAIGSGVGIMLAAAAGRVLTSVLVGVPPLDPAILSGTTVLFAIIGAGACYLPARRATRIDAMEALRYE